MIEKKGWKRFVFSELNPDPVPLFHETDPRIRIRIKMKRIRHISLRNMAMFSLWNKSQLCKYYFQSLLSQKPNSRIVKSIVCLVYTEIANIIYLRTFLHSFFRVDTLKKFFENCIFGIGREFMVGQTQGYYDPFKNNFFEI